ncbi:hypothetical protein B0T24DRAFT_274048 [Lasiosphaeria ovina]|uniref:LPXTG-domain-containing protein n=1 Tax=Lasiosphaeria ovina TaxID=92902 RepID=A0AAE0KCR0_9PEZI|nr:hypothetical protein B0T24DRAFT_274048 [Lasiosphaeria ovina]
MHYSRWCQVLVAWPILCHWGLALQVSSDSACASSCLSVTLGQPGANPRALADQPLACTDKDFDSSSSGREFQSCINCLQTSTSVTGAESDLYWFVYGLRSTLDSCLFSAQNETRLPASCAADSQCGSLRDSFAEAPLSSSSPELQYCVKGDSSFQQQATSCSKCLRKNGQAYMSNFLTAFDAGCSQVQTSGSSLGIKGPLFSTEEVTTPSDPTQSVVSNDNPLTTVTVVTISAGSSLLVISIAALIIMFFRRRSRIAKRKSFGNYIPNSPISKAHFTHATHAETHGLAELGITGMGYNRRQTVQNPAAANNGRLVAGRRYTGPPRRRPNPPDTRSVRRPPPIYLSPTGEPWVRVPPPRAPLPPPPPSTSRLTARSSTSVTSPRPLHRPSQELNFQFPSPPTYEHLPTSLALVTSPRLRGWTMSSDASRHFETPLGIVQPSSPATSPQSLWRPSLELKSG